MATINPSQDYDFISTLTFGSASGTCRIRLYRGNNSAFSGTVYYRAGTSGAWTSLAVSGTSTTFPVSSTTMQVANDWNKSGNNYMTQCFLHLFGSGNNTNLRGLTISQKAVLSGVVGDFFMYQYAHSCSALTNLDIPDTSGVTSTGRDFISNYALNCSSLTSLDVPDTSNITTAGNGFLEGYAYGCSSLTTLSIPNTSNISSVGYFFIASFAGNCTSLITLNLPAVGWFETNNIDWSVPSSRLGILKGYVVNPDDLAGWKALTDSGETLYTNYIRDPDDVRLLPNPYVAIKIDGVFTYVDTKTKTGGSFF